MVSFNACSPEITFFRYNVNCQSGSEVKVDLDCILPYKKRWRITQRRYEFILLVLSYIRDKHFCISNLHATIRSNRRCNFFFNTVTLLLIVKNLLKDCEIDLLYKLAFMLISRMFFRPTLVLTLDIETRRESDSDLCKVLFLL